MPASQNDHVIQAFSADGPYDALRVWIGLSRQLLVNGTLRLKYFTLPTRFILCVVNNSI